MGEGEPPSVIVEVPVRACDVGGWTDTWFAGHGRVCSLAVEPGVCVTATARPGLGVVTIDAVDYEVTFEMGSEPEEHRLLAEAVREAGRPVGADVRLTVSSAVPPGAALGTSASVCVGVIAALDALGDRVRETGLLAAAAHRAEAERLGRQSGIQDQQAAAHGGASFIEMRGYPHARAARVGLSPSMWAALGDRLVHVAYGVPHDSSAVHEEVIGVLEDEGPASPRLERLRQLADRARDALESGQLDRYGAVLTAATEAQAALSPSLISEGAHQLIELARSHQAIGWKVNGAGGGGGSLSILCRQATDGPRLLDAAAELGHQPLSLTLAVQGARVVARPR